MNRLLDDIGLIAPAPNPVFGVGAQAVGQPGIRQFWYWIVTYYPIGTSIGGPYLVRDAPQPLTASNYVQIVWTASLGALKYDVLRTDTPELPDGPALIELASGITQTTWLDQGQPPALYNIAALQWGAPVQCHIHLNNRDYDRPTVELPCQIKVSTIVFNDGTSMSTAPGGGPNVTADCVVLNPAIGPMYICLDAASDMQFSDRNVTGRMWLTQAGRLGINTATPAFPVDVVASSPDDYILRILSTGNFAGLVIDVTDPIGGESLISFRSAGHECAVIEYDSDEDALIFWTGQRDAILSTLCCDTNSRVGILTTSPAYELDVVGDIHASGCVYIGPFPASLCADAAGDLTIGGNVNITGNLTVQGSFPGGGGGGSAPRGDTIIDMFTLSLPSTLTTEGTNMAREFYIGEDGWGPWTFTISQNGGPWIPAADPSQNGRALGNGWYAVTYRNTAPTDPNFPANDFAIGSVVWYGTCPQGSVTWCDKSGG